MILANNGHLESFGFVANRLMHAYLSASMTADLPADALKTPGGNRSITRTCASFLPGMVASEADLRRTAAVQTARFADRLPALARVNQDCTWAGHLCLTRNGVSVARELEPGFYSGTELAMDLQTDTTRRFAAEAEPTKLPPKPFSTIEAHVFLRLIDWRVGAD